MAQTHLGSAGFSVPGMVFTLAEVLFPGFGFSVLVVFPVPVAVFSFAAWVFWVTTQSDEHEFSDNECVFSKDPDLDSSKNTLIFRTKGTGYILLKIRGAIGMFQMDSVHKLALHDHPHIDLACHLPFHADSCCHTAGNWKCLRDYSRIHEIY